LINSSVVNYNAELCTYHPVMQHQLHDDISHIRQHVGMQTEHTRVDKVVD